MHKYPQAIDDVEPTAALSPVAPQLIGDRKPSHLNDNLLKPSVCPWIDADEVMEGHKPASLGIT